MNMHRHLRIPIVGFFSLVCGTALLFNQPALAASDEAAKSLSGKTVRIIVGYSAGGGFDTLTRIVARHLPKNLPGNPNIIVSHMTVAAVQMIAMREKG